MWIPPAELRLPEAVIWVITAAMVEAAVIDGWKLKVPNWLTYNFMGAGILYWLVADGGSGLSFSLWGVLAGMVLFPLYFVGGMGAGDVKLHMGIGAWVGWKAALIIGAICAVVGGLMAVVMMLKEGDLAKRYVRVQEILGEFRALSKDRSKLDEVKAKALERKEADLKAKMLLPYGIPLVLAAIGYLAYSKWYFQSWFSTSA